MRTSVPVAVMVVVVMAVALSALSAAVEAEEIAAAAVVVETEHELAPMKPPGPASERGYGNEVPVHQMTETSD